MIELRYYQKREIGEEEWVGAIHLLVAEGPWFRHWELMCPVVGSSRAPSVPPVRLPAAGDGARSPGPDRGRNSVCVRTTSLT
jgi:hypothetical protein